MKSSLGSGAAIAAGVLFVCLRAARAAEDPAVVLARTLAVRGVLTAEDVAGVERAVNGTRVEVLAGLLNRKGVLTNRDLTELGFATAARAQQTVTAPKDAPKKNAVSLYGTVLLNAFYNTAGTNIQDIPLFATKQGADATGGDKNLGMTARQSRLGLRFQGVNAGSAVVSGVVEADFLGGKTALPNGVNMDLLRLRLAYARLDWKTFSVQAGQDWSIFAPLNPVTLAEFAIPGLSTSGNAWIRTPQVRAEYLTPLGSQSRMVWQVEATDPNLGDYPTGSFATARTPGVGERGRMPAIDARAGFTRTHNGRDFTVGVSSHYGRGKNFGGAGRESPRAGVDSWGAAVDYLLPVTRRFTITGEAFEGRALGIFSSAAGEAVGAVGTPGEHGVLSAGGWVQAQFVLGRRWQANLAYGGEVMKASQLPAGGRSRNQTYTGNLLFKLTPAMTWAWEYRRLLTDFRAQLAANERGDAVNMAIAYTF